MEQHEFQELIAHPEILDSTTLLSLREMVARYPYFQTAWILYLKNLFVLSDPTFKDELRRGALYVADLSLLFYYIEGERFLIKKHDSEGELCESRDSDRTLDLIDRFLSEVPEQVIPAKTVSEMEIPLEMPGDYTSVLLSEVTDEEKETSPLQGQDLIDQFIEKSEAGTSEVYPIHPEEETTESVQEIQTSVDQIGESNSEEEFNAEQPEDESEESYFTETLAKIYVRQQRYDKALEIIKKLNLKYPKKNAYFADQIRFLEKLIINAKSK